MYDSELRDALRAAKEKLGEQNDLIEELLSPPFKLGTFVAKTTDQDGVVLIGESFAEVSLVAIGHKNLPGLKFGDLVRVTEEGNVAGILSGLALNMGSIASVKEVGDGWVEIDGPNGVCRVMTDYDFEAEPGCRIVLDSTGYLAKENLGKADNSYLREATNLTWDDIGGLFSAKEQMIEAVELPMLHPDIYEAYSQKPIKGVLLYGPPGCGKTLLGKATATSMALSQGASNSTGFIYVKGPEVLSKWVGESEGKIRQLFAMARDHKADTGYPAVIFIDEADALLGRRGKGNGGGVQSTIVPTFLAEMDGLDDAGAMVLLATNMPNSLDPAVVRPGRIDRKIKISRPDSISSKEILKIHLRGKRLSITVDEAADLIVDALFNSDIRVQNRPISEVLNGAMLEGIVSRATSLAIKSDIRRGKLGGITSQHIEDAITLVSTQDEDVDVSEL
jgi:proteasome-associated ATPase